MAEVCRAHPAWPCGPLDPTSSTPLLLNISYYPLQSLCSFLLCFGVSLGLKNGLRIQRLQWKGKGRKAPLCNGILLTKILTWVTWHPFRPLFVFVNDFVIFEKRSCQGANELNWGRIGWTFRGSTVFVQAKNILSPVWITEVSSEEDSFKGRCCDCAQL